MWKDYGYGCYLRRVAGLFDLRIVRPIAVAGAEQPKLQVYINDKKFVATFPDTMEGVQEAKDFLNNEMVRRCEKALLELKRESDER